MTDIITQIRGLAAYAAKALLAVAVPIVTMFVADALDVLSQGVETTLAAAAAGVVVYLVPNKATPTG